MEKMTVDDKLGLDKFTTDEEHPHIEINEMYSNEEDIMCLVKACPAGLYRFDNAVLSFSHEGCLECGTCRVLSGGKIVTKWEYPAGDFGVEYKRS